MRVVHIRVWGDIHGTSRLTEAQHGKIIHTCYSKVACSCCNMHAMIAEKSTNLLMPTMLHSPAIRQLHVDVALQQDSKQVHIVVPRFAALLQGWLCGGIQMAEVHLLQPSMGDYPMMNSVAVAWCRLQVLGHIIAEEMEGRASI